jgi:hypothetical protein
MPFYTVSVTVQLHAETAQEAYSHIRYALDGAKKAEIVHVDSEITGTYDEEDTGDPDAWSGGFSDNH